MIVRCFVVTMMMTAAAGSVLAQQPPATPAQPARGRVATQQPPPPPPPPPATLAQPARGRVATSQAPPPPSPPPVQGQGARSAQRGGQPINVKIDVTITDQQGSSTPIRKVLSVVVGDGFNGSVRSTSFFNNLPGSNGQVPLNMDVYPTLLSDGKVRVDLRLQYDLPSSAALRNAGGEERQLTRTSLNESVVLVLENGKPMVAAQSAEPVSDRQVTLEVKATILR
jgi:hypothetical protein